jgi:hypothetical protein
LSAALAAFLEEGVILMASKVLPLLLLLAGAFALLLVLFWLNADRPTEKQTVISEPPGDTLNSVPTTTDRPALAVAAIQSVLDDLRTGGLLTLAPRLPAESRSALVDLNATLLKAEREIRGKQDVTVRLDWRIEPGSVRVTGSSERRATGQLRQCAGEGRFTFRRDGYRQAALAVLHETTTPLTAAGAFALQPPPSFERLTEDLAEPRLLRTLRAAAPRTTGQAPLFIHLAGLASHPRQVDVVHVRELPGSNGEQKIVAITVLERVVAIEVELTEDSRSVETLISLAGQPPASLLRKLENENRSGED